LTLKEEDANVNKTKVSRRNFLVGAAAGGIIAAVAVAGVEEMRILSIKGGGTTTTVTNTVTVTTPGGTTTVTATTPPATTSVISLNVNSKPYTLNVDNRWSLADTLRERLNMIGTKLGCDRGECGACAVLVDGVPMLSCMMLAIHAQGKSITTIEGIGMPENLSKLQASLADNEGTQCGACASGIVVVATALLKAKPTPTEADVRAALAGNLCKCGNWPYVFQGVLAVKS